MLRSMVYYSEPVINLYSARHFMHRGHSVVGYLRWSEEILNKVKEKASNKRRYLE